MPLFGKPSIEKMLEKRDIRGLCKALGRLDDDSNRASEALVKIGEDAVDPLIKILEDANRTRRWRARFRTQIWFVAQILGKIGDARAVDPLIEALKNDEYSEVQQSAAEALGKIGDARAVHPLIAALKEPVTSWRAAEALGRIGEAAMGPLTTALEKIEESERTRIADAVTTAFVEKKSFAPTHLTGVPDLSRASAEPYIRVDSSGKIEISKRTLDVLFGEKSPGAGAEEKEVQQTSKSSDAQKFVCSECGEEIPHAIRYEPPDMTMRCAVIARQCSCGWTCCSRCDPTHNQPENGHKCQKCGKFRTGWVSWDPHSNLVDRAGWTQIDGERDYWFKGGLYKKWRGDRELDRWTAIRRDLAKRLDL